MDMDLLSTKVLNGSSSSFGFWLDVEESERTICFGRWRFVVVLQSHWVGDENVSLILVGQLVTNHPHGGFNMFHTLISSGWNHHGMLLLIQFYWTSYCHRFRHNVIASRIATKFSSTIIWQMFLIPIFNMISDQWSDEWSVINVQMNDQCSVIIDQHYAICWYNCFRLKKNWINNFYWINENLIDWTW